MRLLFHGLWPGAKIVITKDEDGNDLYDLYSGDETCPESHVALVRPSGDIIVHGAQPLEVEIRLEEDDE